MKYHNECTDQVIELLKKSGEKLKGLYYSSITITEKQPKDYVTSADLLIDDFLKQNLPAIIDGVPIYSEENSTNTYSDNQWIVDPLDGTTNFILGIPHFAISVAYREGGDIIAGFVYNPVSCEMYWTDPWNCAYLNNLEIHVSNRTEKTQMYGLFGFSANYHNISRYHDEWNELFSNSKKAIGILSPSLSICSVAKGKADYFIDFGCSIEGKLAAAEILRKAGGTVYDYNKEQYSIDSVGIIATNRGSIF